MSKSNLHKVSVAARVWPGSHSVAKETRDSKGQAGWAAHPCGHPPDWGLGPVELYERWFDGNYMLCASMVMSHITKRVGHFDLGGDVARTLPSHASDLPVLTYSYLWPHHKGPRGIVSGKIKIAGAIELAEQLEEVFRKAKGPEKTLAYLDAKRVKSEKARARLWRMILPFTNVALDGRETWAIHKWAFSHYFALWSSFCFCLCDLGH